MAYKDAKPKRKRKRRRAQSGCWDSIQGKRSRTWQTGSWEGSEGLVRWRLRRRSRSSWPEAVEEAGVPAEGSRGEGVTDVVVAVTKGTFAVLPGLASENGGESEEKDGVAVIGEEGRQVEAGVELEGVVFGGVVGEKRGGGEGRVTVGERQRKEVGFGGWRLPLLGLTRRDQVEKPVVFQADRERES